MLVGPDPSERHGLSLVARPHLVWARSIEVAEEFEESELFMVVLDLLRTAGHDVVAVADAMVLASAHVGEHPRDLVARRAVGLLRRALVFLGGDPGHSVRWRHPQSGSRCTSSKEKAGRQIETYSAPSADGVL